VEEGGEAAHSGTVIGVFEKQGSGNLAREIPFQGPAKGRLSRVRRQLADFEFLIKPTRQQRSRRLIESGVFPETGACGKLSRKTERLVSRDSKRSPNRRRAIKCQQRNRVTKTDATGSQSCVGLAISK
jgi:hypothetical protein